MNFNRHLNLIGKHAMFPASQPYWLGYSEDKLVDRWYTMSAAEKGTELHAIAASLIVNNIKLPRSKKTLNMYVNDAIGYVMEPEQPLYFSDNFFGTADAISFRKDHLRIHDLKTGVGLVHIEQLRLYAAYFCLEYGIAPGDIQIDLAIYQNNDIRHESPDADIILPIMDKIITFDKIITKLKSEEE